MQHRGVLRVVIGFQQRLPVIIRCLVSGAVEIGTGRVISGAVLVGFRSVLTGRCTVLAGTSVRHGKLVHGDHAEDQRREEEESECDSRSRAHSMPFVDAYPHRQRTPAAAVIPG